MSSEVDTADRFREWFAVIWGRLIHRKECVCHINHLEHIYTTRTHWSIRTLQYAKTHVWTRWWWWWWPTTAERRRQCVWCVVVVLFTINHSFGRTRYGRRRWWQHQRPWWQRRRPTADTTRTMSTDVFVVVCDECNCTRRPGSTCWLLMVGQKCGWRLVTVFVRLLLLLLRPT